MILEPDVKEAVYHFSSTEIIQRADSMIMPHTVIYLMVK